MQEKGSFYADIVEACEKISKLTSGRMLTATLMVQAALETGYDSRGVWQGIAGWKGINNLSGISPGGVIKDFSSLAEYESAYATVILQPAFGYPAVLDAGARGVPAQLKALGESAWSVTHYAQGGEPGGKLQIIWGTDQAIIEEMIAKHDEWSGQTTVASAPAEAPGAQHLPPPGADTQASTTAQTVQSSVVAALTHIQDVAAAALKQIG